MIKDLLGIDLIVGAAIERLAVDLVAYFNIMV